MRKAKKDENKQVLEIKDSVKINDDTILEKGDKIEILKEVSLSFDVKGELRDTLTKAIMNAVENSAFGQPDPSVVASDIAEIMEEAAGEASGGQWTDDFLEGLAIALKTR